MCFYYGTFEGIKDCKGKNRILVLDVTHNGEVFRDHLWIYHTRSRAKQKNYLTRGDKIKFTGDEIQYLSNGKLKKGFSRVRNIMKDINGS